MEGSKWPTGQAIRLAEAYFETDDIPGQEISNPTLHAFAPVASIEFPPGYMSGHAFKLTAILGPPQFPLDGSPRYTAQQIRSPANCAFFKATGSDDPELFHLFMVIASQLDSNDLIDADEALSRIPRQFKVPCLALLLDSRKPMWVRQPSNFAYSILCNHLEAADRAVLVGKIRLPQHFAMTLCIRGKRPDIQVLIETHSPRYLLRLYAKCHTHFSPAEHILLRERFHAIFQSLVPHHRGDSILPRPILQIIAGQLETCDDLAAFRLTCRAWRTASFPFFAPPIPPDAPPKLLALVWETYPEGALLRLPLPPLMDQRTFEKFPFSAHLFHLRRAGNEWIFLDWILFIYIPPKDHPTAHYPAIQALLDASATPKTIPRIAQIINRRQAHKACRLLLTMLPKDLRRRLMAQVKLKKISSE